MRPVAAGAGGGLAGRLRSKRVAVHTGVDCFGDTAHKFLAQTAGAREFKFTDLIDYPPNVQKLCEEGHGSK